MKEPTTLEKIEREFDEKFPFSEFFVYGRDDAIKLKESIRDFLHTSYNTMLDEAVERIEKIEAFIAVKDNDTHRYQIPASKFDEWNKFLEIPEDDERAWDVPEWAERIDGMPVKSVKEQVLSTLQELKSEI